MCCGRDVVFGSGLRKVKKKNLYKCLFELRGREYAADMAFVCSPPPPPPDVTDLRRHTTYYGGYHDSHRTIQWLWECVTELDAQERALFLKFVTSCSKVRSKEWRTCPADGLNGIAICS